MATFADIDPTRAERRLHVPGDWRRPGINASYDILWDPGRSFGQLWPRPSPKDIAGFYDVETYYTHGTPGPRSGKGPNLMQRLHDKLSWLADAGVEPDADWWARVLGRHRLRLLEIGCGNGSNMTLLRALGHTVIGVEPDPVAAAVAREAGHEVHAGTAEHLPDAVSGDQFDAVIFMHVVEHCLDPFAALRNAVALLAERGLVVAEVPNNACLGSRRFGPLWHWLDVPRHLNFFTGQSLCDLFEAAGLAVDQMCHRGYCRQVSSGWKATQRQIADAFGRPDDSRLSPRSYSRHLLDTAWAADALKYDSVRVVGRRRAPSDPESI